MQPSSEPASSGSGQPRTRALGLEEIGFVALLVLSLGGMAIADFSAQWGLSYWLAVIPLFGAVSVYSGWRRARAAGENIGRVLVRQLLHWGAAALAVYLIFVLERSGRLNQEDAGLVALLLLSLSTILAGLHFDWRLSVLGVLLAVVAVCAALVEEFFWILVLPFAAAGLGVVVWQRWKPGS